MSLSDDRQRASVANIGRNIRSVRQRARITLRVLAEQTSLTEAHLSKVERGLSSPSIASLDRIADALDVSITQLLAGRDSDEILPFTRAHSRQVRRLSVGIEYEELIPSRQEGPLSAGIFTVQPGQGSGGISQHLGYEYRMSLDGEIVYYLDGERIVLQAGDCLFAEAQVPHRWANESDTECRMLVVGTMPLRSVR